MAERTDKTERKRPGPKPKLISLHPLQFEEVVDALLKKKQKKSSRKKIDEKENAPQK